MLWEKSNYDNPAFCAESDDVHRWNFNARPSAGAFARADINHGYLKPIESAVLFVMRLAKFDAKLRQWRTLELRADVSGSRLKNRTEHNSVESFLGLKNGGFSPFRSEGAFCGSQKSQW